jgi:hypothetical protein
MQARLVGPEHVILRISHVAKQANEEIAPGTARNVRVALKGQARDSAERAQRRAEARDQPILQRVDALVQPAARRAADPIRVGLDCQSKSASDTWLARARESNPGYAQYGK